MGKNLWLLSKTFGENVDRLEAISNFKGKYNRDLRLMVKAEQGADKGYKRLGVQISRGDNSIQLQQEAAGFFAVINNDEKFAFSYGSSPLSRAVSERGVEAFLKLAAVRLNALGREDISQVTSIIESNQKLIVNEFNNIINSLKRATDFSPGVSRV